MREEKLIVVGAAGIQARTMIKLLRTAGYDGTIVGIDRSWTPQAQEELAGTGIHYHTVDARRTPEMLAQLCGGAQLIANFAGPFFELGPVVLDVAIETGANYLDICDDVDATERLLMADARARAAGITALVGMGASPGTTNVLARLGLDALGGDKREARVDLAWTVPCEDMRSASLLHLLHGFRTALPGRADVPGWSELQPMTVDFPDPVGPVQVVLLGHPEPLTIPHFLGARTVNRGGLTPEPHLHVLWALARTLSARAAGEPEDFASVSAVFDAYDRLTRSARTRIGSGMRIDVTRGERGFRFISGTSMSMELATAVPAAAGVTLLLAGKAPRVGVLAPECLDPRDFFAHTRKISPGGGSLQLFELSAGEPVRPLRIRDLLSA